MATDTDNEEIATFQAEIWGEEEERENNRAQLSKVFVPIQ
jgi:hypothetical protein